MYVIQIYKETLIDLLTPRVEQDQEAVIIWEDPSSGIKVWLEKRLVVSLWPRCKSCPTTTIMMVTLCLGVGRRGRPEIEISMEMITALVKDGYTARRIAEMIGCSTSFVYNKLYRDGLMNMMRHRYSCDTDVVLRGKIKSINQEFPPSGSVVSI